MDSLGGILIKGLLGNPILARFSLFIDILIEDITPTPTPYPSATLPTPTVTVTPTVTPTPVVIVGGGGGRYPDLSDNERLIKITLVYKGKQSISIHKVNNNTLRISINILKGITYLKEKAYSVYVSLRKSVNNIKVKINGNGNRD